MFVTGTDTGVGKTVVSAALMHRYRGSTVRYWKPVQTGIEQDDDTAEVRRLSGCRASGVVDEGIRLAHPVSPHLAARLNNTAIDVDATAGMLGMRAHDSSWIVEGAGGVFVPLNDTALMVDLMSRLGLPALVVSRSALGTINHTLLTLDALARRSIRVAGVVMTGPPNPDNREAIERWGRVRVLGELPPLAPLSPEALQSWAEAELDVTGALGEHLS